MEVEEEVQRGDRKPEHQCHHCAEQATHYTLRVPLKQSLISIHTRTSTRMHTHTYTDSSTMVLSVSFLS